MKKEILQFIEENNLSPLSSLKSPLRPIKSIFQTRDGKTIHQKVLSEISKNFIFPETSNIFNFFDFSEDELVIKKRQDFFKELKSIFRENNSFLTHVKNPKPSWKPKYDVLVVTEDSSVFNKMKEMGCPVRILVSESDISLLESCDLIQAINCPEFSPILESLPQTVFLKSVEEAYLERYLEELSGWRNNLELLNHYNLGDELNNVVSDLISALSLIDDSPVENLHKELVESKVDIINSEIYKRIKDFMISGDSLFSLVSKKQLPSEIKSVILEEIKKVGIPIEVLEIEIPVKIDESELEKFLQRQNANEFFETSLKIKNASAKLKDVPKKLKKLMTELIFFDFASGISKFIDGEMNFPELSEQEFFVSNSKNIFLENPSPISFGLNSTYKCSILTGANSGGKTTLLEHLIQIISLTQVGLPSHGESKIPNFSEIYYFAKNKGADNKGAFENLLNQMSKINPGKKTLILADEIESVTEPGVAGKIISATVDFFTARECFLVVATHLGHEIQKNLPEKTRIDGIEAKGLDSNFNLIVDHNPVLGRLAHSTPELIVEKLANSEKKEYFVHLNNVLKKNTLKDKVDISIVYLVAGMSSRFGGNPKAFAKVGPNDETLIEYSLNQSLKAGFSKIIFVVSKGTYDLFRDFFGDSYHDVPVEYAIQTFDSSTREKPWGTVDAICAARKILNTPFVVCNGDDIYGEESFKVLFNHLTHYKTSASVGYRIKDVLPDFGEVNRGIFEIDSESFAKRINEIFGISRDNLFEKGFDDFTLCSMNLFALTLEALDKLSLNLDEFKLNNRNNRIVECILSSEISKLIVQQKIKLKIYPTESKWYGITNKDDGEFVRMKILFDSK